MKKIIVYIVFIICVAFISCITDHRSFTYYREPVFIKDNSKYIKLNGKYIVNSNLNQYIFFDKDYKDVKINYPAREFYLYNDGGFYIDFHGINGETENWGQYIIRGDSIYIQFFIRDAGRLVIRFPNELIGVIKDDSIIILKNINKYGSGLNGLRPELTIYNPPAVYYFVNAQNKPDSNIAWYRHTRWYKKWKSVKEK